MKGQVFTVAKLHYINGVVYFTASEGATDITTLAKHSAETTKSGKAKHPAVRVRTLVRLAEGIGLVKRVGRHRVELTDLGNRYNDARMADKWTISDKQKEMLRGYILLNPSYSPTIHSIVSLLGLVQSDYKGKELSRRYADAIGKQDAWRSDFTYEGFTNFGLSYLNELGFLEEKIDLQHFSDVPKKVISQPYKKRTFLFTWNPKKWQWKDLPQAVYEANAEGRYLDKWSCVTTRHISPGDRAFLIRLGEPPKGIIGSGVIVSEPFEDLHWDSARAKKGDTVHRVEILFDVLSETPILDETALASGVLAQHGWFPQASGTPIPVGIAEHLESVWSRVTKTSFEPLEITDIESLRIEGTKYSRLVTSYERNPEAREDCLNHHGRHCQVCGLAFEERYGIIGKGFIHVHHLVPVSEIGGEYEVNPINDLCPVCPNCHAMLHKRTPPISIDELKEMMGASKKNGVVGYGKKRLS